MLGNMIRGWNEMSTYRKIRRVFMIGLAVFGLWALTPYLYNRRVDEMFPVAVPASQAVAPATAAPAMADQAAPTAMMVDNAAMAEQAAPTAVMADNAAMADKTAPTAMMADNAAMAGQAAPTAIAAPAGPVALTTGTFIAGSTPGDKAGGKATIYQLEDGKPLLRLEDFSTTNGPDLFVVLSSSANPDQDGLKNGAYVQLDALKGNVGNQNYELPADVDLSQYKSVVIWCRTFNIVFGYATLQSTS
jgi:Electron transfer DM13